VRGARSALLAVQVVLVACSRTGLYLGSDSMDGGLDASTKPSPPCALDSDCVSDDLCMRGACELAMDDAGVGACRFVPVSCDDNDACSLDSCGALDGRCVHERPVDKDKDGHVGQSPAGLPSSCYGKDCNDDDPAIFPGAREICDGLDNDCFGGIDDGSLYSATSAPVPVAPGMGQSEVTGIAFDGAGYGAVYTRRLPGVRDQGYFERLSPTGQVIIGPVLVSEINADTFSGSLAYSGTSFLTAWPDARQAGNYEIYATRFDREANKLQPDLRLTNAVDFSIDPFVRHTGEEYLVVWEDHRDDEVGGVRAIYGRRLSDSGEPLGDEVRLTDTDESAQFASFDVGEQRLGLAYVVGDLAPGTGARPTAVRFRTFDRSLGDPGARVELAAGARGPTLRRAGERFVVTWHTGDLQQAFSGALHAATLDDGGAIIAAGEVSSGDAYTRSHTLVSLGDRVLLVWAARPADPDRYHFFYETLRTETLEVVTSRQLLAKSSSDTDFVAPQAVQGPNGDVAVVFNENDNGIDQALFLRLACAIP
jgi:hypothetical protein